MCFFPQSVTRSSRIVSLICLGLTAILSVTVVAQQRPPQQTNATALIGRMRPGKYTVDEVRMPRLGYLLSLAA